MNLVPDINEFEASETSSSSIVPVKNPVQRKKQQEKRRKPSEDETDEDREEFEGIEEPVNKRGPNLMYDHIASSKNLSLFLPLLV